MRPCTGLLLLVASGAFAAPQKEELPPGAVGRLGTAINPVTEGPRLGEVTAILHHGDNTLYARTTVGCTTWYLQKRQARQPRPVGGPTFAVARDTERVLVGSARKLHAIEPVESAMAEPARSWDSATDVVAVAAVAPTGGRAVYTDGDAKLTVLDLRTGIRTGVAELQGRPVAGALTTNGRILGVVTREGTVRLYSLSAAGALESQWFKRVARTDRAAIQFSADGRVVATSSAGRVTVLECVTGRPLTILERKFGE